MFLDQGRQNFEQQRREHPDVVTSDLPSIAFLEKAASGNKYEITEFVDEPSFYLAVLQFQGWFVPFLQYLWSKLWLSVNSDGRSLWVAYVVLACLVCCLIYHTLTNFFCLMLVFLSERLTLMIKCGTISRAWLVGRAFASMPVQALTVAGRVLAWLHGSLCVYAV